MSKKLISIISPTYNEEKNIHELYQQVSRFMNELINYDFEYIFIDNSSIDSTVNKLKEIALVDKRVKIIINTRNFGHIRSPCYGLLQTNGDASIYLASDLQDPPEFIPKFIEMWEAGAKVVMAVKPISNTNLITNTVRKLYYILLDKISDVKIVRDATGFGLYDKKVLDKVREINDPYPYFRGLISELGHEIKTINYVQPRRKNGISKNNFYSLYDIAMLGVVSHSLVPIRIVSICGFFLGTLSFFAAFAMLIIKLTYWGSIPFGVAPLAILILFLVGVVLLSIGMIGEYIGSIHTYLQKRPLVVEKERINW